MDRLSLVITHVVRVSARGGYEASKQAFAEPADGAEITEQAGANKAGIYNATSEGSEISVRPTSGAGDALNEPTVQIKLPGGFKIKLRYFGE